MNRILKYGLGVAAVAGWLAFALSPRGSGQRPAPGPPELDHAELPLVELEGEVLSRDEALGLPAAIEVAGDYLLVADRGGGSPLHAVHREDGRLVPLAREGEGPGEFTAPWVLDPLPGRPGAWVWDIALQRATLVELDGPRPALPLRESPSVALRSPAAVTGAVRLADGGWLAVGLFREGRLGEFGPDGSFLGARGAVPELDEEVPADLAQQAYHGPIAAHPDRGRLAIASLKAGRLEIHDLTEGSAALARVPFAFEPRVSVGQRGDRPALSTGDHVRYGYVALEATSERLYGLFSGRTPAGHPESSTLAGFVHVFDWAGAFLGALRLDADAIALAVDEGAGVLYAVSHHPAPAIWRYRLPQRLERAAEGG